jgi:hypothetical protein
MNSNVMPSRVQVEPTLLQHLVAEVRETVAMGVNTPGTAPAPSFKAIDLWNIQRRGRYANVNTKRKKNATLSVSHVSF